MDKFYNKIKRQMRTNQYKNSKQEKTKIGIVIGTFGSMEYIELHLATKLKLYPNIPIIVHDDCSQDGGKLFKLCEKYGVDFYSSHKRLGWCSGDIHAFSIGLHWGRKKGLDILVKFSRRFIPKINFIPKLQNLVKTGHTFGNSTDSGHPIRTECFAVRIESWYKKHKIISKYASDNRGKIFYVESLIFCWATEIARTANYNVFDKWDIMATNFLFHQNNQPSEYVKLAKFYGLDLKFRSYDSRLQNNS